jgi:hypothetical protein
MSKAAPAIALSVFLLFAAAPSEAGGGRHGHGHGGHRYGRVYYGGPRVVVGVGPGVWWGPGFWYGRPWYGPGPYYSYAPPPVVVQQPMVYVERPPAPAAPSGFWYYCESAGAYYPSVSTCPEPWVQVAPRPE